MEYQVNIKYPKSEAEKIFNWCARNYEYELKDYEDYIEVVLVSNWQEIQTHRLRVEREKICFPVVNRGELWYNKLTAEQKEELNIWYQSWLDVTITKVKPITPYWLK